jgi:hypothetical protein
MPKTGACCQLHVFEPLFLFAHVGLCNLSKNVADRHGGNPKLAPVNIPRGRTIQWNDCAGHLKTRLAADSRQNRLLVLLSAALCRSGLDRPEAKEIAAVIPWFPFKGVPRFYDIGGFLAQPEIFQKVVDIFAKRYVLVFVGSASLVACLTLTVERTALSAGCFHRG